MSRSPPLPFSECGATVKSCELLSIDVDIPVGAKWLTYMTGGAKVSNQPPPGRAKKDTNFLNFPWSSVVNEH